MKNKHIKFTSPVDGTKVIYNEDKAKDYWDILKNSFENILAEGGDFDLHIEVYDPEEKIDRLEQKIKELERNRTITTIDSNPWQEQPWNIRPLGVIQTSTYKPGDSLTAE